MRAGPIAEILPAANWVEGPAWTAPAVPAAVSTIARQTTRLPRIL